MSHAIVSGACICGHGVRPSPYAKMDQDFGLELPGGD
jgi:hypothetical protein